MGGQHLPGRGIGHSRIQNLRHILHRQMMLRIVKAGGIDEMGTVGKPQLLRLLVHHLHKGCIGAGNPAGQRHHRIRTAGHDHAVEKVLHRHLLPCRKAAVGGVMGIDIVHNVLGNGQLLTEIRQMLRTDQKGHDLRHGRGIHLRIRILLRHDAVFIQIKDHRILAVDAAADALGTAVTRELRQIHEARSGAAGAHCRCAFLHRGAFRLRRLHHISRNDDCSTCFTDGCGRSLLRDVQHRLLRQHRHGSRQRQHCRRQQRSHFSFLSFSSHYPLPPLLRPWAESDISCHNR